MTPSRTALSIAASLAVAANAMAASAPATEATKLSSQYSDWAGGRPTPIPSSRDCAMPRRSRSSPTGPTAA
jgi:hypothetical protein